jgi:RHS repeat-associated protein
LYGSSRLGITSAPTVANDLATAVAVGYGTAQFATFTRKEKLFKMANHLGNVLLTISDKKLQGALAATPTLVSFWTADVQTAQDYYPFGMLMPRRSYKQTGQNYRYGFNGKENDNDVKGEGNQQDYGMRIYDTRLGRFLSVDPLDREYPFYSPYKFAGNSPIANIDLDGKEPELSTIDFGNGYKQRILNIKMAVVGVENFSNSSNISKQHSGQIKFLTMHFKIHKKVKVQYLLISISLRV